VTLDCAWRDCKRPAVLELLFDHRGRAPRSLGGRSTHSLGTYVRYCAEHGAETQRLFFTANVRPVRLAGAHTRQAA
jgi:hypothetical protein